MVAALHRIAAHELSLLGHTIEADGFLCGDDAAAKDRVGELIRALGVRPVDVGALKNAPLLEAMTPLLIEINKKHKVKSAGLRVTGIEQVRSATALRRPAARPCGARSRDPKE